MKVEAYIGHADSVREGILRGQAYANIVGNIIRENDFQDLSGDM